MIRGPPSSALFAYPTLFRSGAVLRFGRHVLAAAAEGQPPGAGPEARPDRGGRRRLRRRGEPRLPAAAGHRPAPPPDRKSTRLNFSHAHISYAVLRLQK